MLCMQKNMCFEQNGLFMHAEGYMLQEKRAIGLGYMSKLQNNYIFIYTVKKTLSDVCKATFPKTWSLLTSRLSASSSLLNPVGRGEAVVISITYKSVLRLLHSLPILSQREPSTSKLKRSVSSPRLIFKKNKPNFIV